MSTHREGGLTSDKTEAAKFFKMPNDQENKASGIGFESSGMSRRRFLGLSVGTLAAGAVASVLLAPARVFASAADSSDAASSSSAKSGWRIVLQDGYPYPDSVRRYAARAVFSSKEEALQKILSREYPISIRKVE